MSPISMARLTAIHNVFLYCILSFLPQDTDVVPPPT
jgi:hypothetical protein